jgi:SPP1 family predicted phage head-tail adaptor
MPRIGNRRLLVTFQTRDAGQSAMLDPKRTWSDAFQDYVSLVPLNGRELMAAQSIQNAATHKVEMRYRPGVLATMRIKYFDSEENKERHFNITSPARNVNSRYRLLQFEVQEGLRDG